MFPYKRVGVLSTSERARQYIDRLRGSMAGVAAELIVLNETPHDPPPDVIVVLGGDGTVLHALRAYPHVPVLPINFGKVGFLTAGDEEDFDRLIARLLANDYFIEERLLLVAEFQGQRREVVNEVVIKGATKMTHVELHVDGERIHTFRGDGVIVGTPTGSTSYLMSTGSAIVSPQVQCLIVNGINEHRFASRSLILPPTTLVRLRLGEETRETQMFVSHDGRDKLPIAVGEEIAIRKSDRPSRLIFFDRHSFFKNLKSRLDW